MNSNRPKYLKAILFNNNVAEVSRSVVQSQCFTVQDYHYHCYRERNEQGEPYGGILSKYLDFSVVVTDPAACKFFYRCMDTNENAPFSFLFNASFRESGRLYDFEDGMITYGHVTEVEEMCMNGDQSGEEQLLIHVKLLVSNIIFIGNNSYHFLEITKD